MLHFNLTSYSLCELAISEEDALVGGVQGWEKATMTTTPMGLCWTFLLDCGAQNEVFGLTPKSCSGHQKQSPSLPPLTRILDLTPEALSTP